TTPSARLRMLRSFLLIAQTPLLVEEGKVREFTVGQHALRRVWAQRNLAFRLDRTRAEARDYILDRIRQIYSHLLRTLQSNLSPSRLPTAFQASRRSVPDWLAWGARAARSACRLRRGSSSEGRDSRRVASRSVRRCRRAWGRRTCLRW